jgi:hypothetical protein
MKIYRIYIYEDGKQTHCDTCYTSIEVNSIISAKDMAFKLLVVNTFTCDMDDADKKEKFKKSIVYLGGLPVRKYTHRADETDIEALKKRLTILYKADGTILYYPERPFDVPELKEMFGGWFHCKIVKTNPHRMAIVHYDWEQFEINQPKVRNIKASELFGLELFGDVLYVNEKFIS